MINCMKHCTEMADTKPSSFLQRCRLSSSRQHLSATPSRWRPLSEAAGMSAPSYHPPSCPTWAWERKTCHLASEPARFLHCCSSYRHTSESTWHCSSTSMVRQVFGFFFFNHSVSSIITKFGGYVNHDRTHENVSRTNAWNWIWIWPF